MSIFKLLFGIDETPSKQPEGLTAEMKLAIRDEVDNRLNNPSSSFDEHIKQKVEENLEKHTQNYKRYLWVGAAILALFGYKLEFTLPQDITTALGKRNIDTTIAKVVGSKVDELVIPDIELEVSNKLNPTLLKLSSANDDSSQLLEAMNQDKTSISNLFTKANNPTNANSYLQQMLGTILEKGQFDAGFILGTQINVQNLDPNPNMLTFSNFYYNVESVSPFLKAATLKVCWGHTNISERDRVGFLIAAMKYDNNLIVEDVCADILNKVSTIAPNFLQVTTLDDWFQKNTNYFSNNGDYILWTITNQFIKR